MKKAYCSWAEDEIKVLFNFVESEKEKNKPLLKIFREFASFSSRKQNSVRNYYYQELQELKNNEEKRKRLGIDLSKHKKCEQNQFEEDEEKLTIKSIIRLTADGFSVRQSCLKLAKGDLSKMTRFQNKYRNIIKTKKDLITECIDELRAEGVIVKDNPFPQNNVLVMPKQKENLSDKDIEALFMGLVRLVKRVANENAHNQTKNQIDFANQNLRKAMVRIANKESQIKQISYDNQMLKQENTTLKQRLQDLRINNTKLKQSKIKELQNFSKNLCCSSSQKLKA